MRAGPPQTRQRVLVGGLVPRGDGGDGGVDQRDLRAEHVAEQAGDPPGHIDPRPAEHRRRQHLDRRDPPGGLVPDRPAAHQRQPLRDLLAPRPQAGAAPEVDHQRARPVAMLLGEPPQHLVRRGAAQRIGGRRRQGARIGGDRGCARSAAHRCAPAPARPPAPAAHARHRARRAARRARPRRRPAGQGRPPPPALRP